MIIIVPWIVTVFPAKEEAEAKVIWAYSQLAF